ncbi:MAG TPA: hypothetical protein DCZ95_12725 [Verrucomicrobia bacterium]|nr:MAG: hypothetical protein A2X46_11940 [Lentisphaerae bacterium GWF2_57_35]HBA84951.1 hypothetical protein [Verrucomicrobiota bacterium]
MRSSWTTRKTDAFTLIEVLASMVVLVILMLALTRVFTEATNAFKKGTTTVMRNGAAESALDLIRHELECAVINERLAFYHEADSVDKTTGSWGANPNGFGFDEVWFVTTGGDQDDGRAYQLVCYDVNEYQATNNLVASKRFRLRRSSWNFDVMDKNSKDPLQPSANNPLLYKDWWLTLSVASGNPEVLIDNIVRFDVYLHTQKGVLLQEESGGISSYSSSKTYPGLYDADMHPAAIDIYLQVTSTEAASQGGANLLYVGSSQDDVWRKGRSLMIRDSNVLMTRIFPIMTPGQWSHPAHYWH